MKKLSKLLAICIVPLALMACDNRDKTTPNAVSTKDSASQNYDEAKKLNFFSTGSMMAANQVYVFFDPQCGHCGKLWQETKGIKEANFNWIPVSILNPKSTKQGAALLASDKPVELMTSHEQQMSSGGMEVESVSADNVKKIEDNTKYFSKNFDSVPLVVFKNLKTNAYETMAGSASQEMVRNRLGLN